MIPVATTTISVARVVYVGTEDGYDAAQPAPTQIATGVRAVISPPTGATQWAGGTQTVYTASLRADPTDLRPGDQVTDAAGTVWTCQWASQVNTLGVAMTVASLRLLTGAV